LLVVDELFLAKYGGWRNTELYEAVEKEVLTPLYECRWHEAWSKPLGPPDYVYRDLRHRVRHVRRQVKKLHQMHFIKWILDSVEVDLLEYLLNGKSGEIWFVPAHHRHSLIVNLVYRWWRKYYGLIFGRLETYYNICYRLLRIVYPFTSWEHDHHIDTALGELEKFLRDIHGFNMFMEKVRMISRSNMTKREKEYWMLQLKNIAYNFWSITEEFRVERFIRGEMRKITFYRLKLDVKTVLRETMEKVEKILDETIHSLRREITDIIHIPEW